MTDVYIGNTDNIPTLEVHSCESSGRSDTEQELRCLSPWAVQRSTQLPGQQLMLQQVTDVLVEHWKLMREKALPGLFSDHPLIPGQQEAADALAKHSELRMEKALPGFIHRIPNPAGFRVKYFWEN